MALTKDRNTLRREGENAAGGLVAGVTVFGGAIVMRTSAGFLTKGQTATGLVGVGCSDEHKVGGAVNGDTRLEYRPGRFLLKNSTSTDAITIADIGKPAYAVDDETVAKTSGTNTRSIAGFVEDVDAATGGVWVRFDEALVQAFLNT